MIITLDAFIYDVGGLTDYQPDALWHLLIFVDFVEKNEALFC